MASRNRSASKVETVPDVLGAAGREQTEDDFVADLLAQTARERTRLLAIQRANKAKPSDKIPGSTRTYGEAVQETHDKDQETLEQFPANVERIRETIKAAQAKK